MDRPASALRPTAGTPIGWGWGEFIHVFAGGSGTIYAVSPDGSLRWYKHLFGSGQTPQAGASIWLAGSGNIIGSGWNEFSWVWSGGNGLIYGALLNGDLQFYRDVGNGTPAWAAGSGNKIGRGWNGFRHILSGGGGVIYVVDSAGNLRWYRDDLMNGTNAPDGSTGWAAASGSAIGNGWQHFMHVFAGAPGQIFACETLDFGG